ncbi:MAG: DUF2079 domain-containing protein [Candidatus Omnitrophica bacterium]|nr:DUF2079 domain-containing protein [Candidatus Omnitrophota bacterium]
MKRALFLSLIFSFLFSLVSLIRHNHYFSQGNDLGIFTQSAWLYSKGYLLYNTITERLDFQDRYKPVMLLLGLLFRFWADPRFLLLIQAFFLSFSGIFVYLISKKVGLGDLTIFILVVSYLLFPGITSFIIDDFHEVSLFPFFFLGSIYFYLKRSKLLYIFLLFSLIIRDYLVFFSLVFWLSLLLSKNKAIKNRLLVRAIIVNLLGLVLMLTVIKLVGGITYGSFNSQGDSLFLTILKFILNPVNLLTSLFLPTVKLKTIFISLGYFAFLPLFNFWLIIPIIFQLASRFLDFEHPYRWGLFYHYSGELAAILVFGTIVSLRSVSRNSRKYFVALIFSFSLLSIVLFHSPLLLLMKAEFWEKEDWMKNNDYILSLVPDDASVATQNNLVPHLSLRKKIYVLPTINDADYVILDLRQGQNRFNFYGLSFEEMKQLQVNLSKRYKLINQKGDAYLYAKINEK